MIFKMLTSFMVDNSEISSLIKIIADKETLLRYLLNNNLAKMK